MNAQLACLGWGEDSVATETRWPEVSQQTPIPGRQEGQDTPGEGASEGLTSLAAGQEVQSRGASTGSHPLWHPIFLGSPLGAVGL